MSDLDLLREELQKDPEYKNYHDEMQTRAELSKALIGLRVKLGLTQKELARLTHMTQSEICRIESCDANPTIKTLKRIADAVGMRVTIQFVPKDESTE